jgi:serine/threonine protein kinase/tetratricopeptide (TPR) repeat protein
MTPERWQQVTALFEGALERPAAERADFLAGACGADHSLQAEVEKLLAQSDRASREAFLLPPENLTAPRKDALPRAAADRNLLFGIVALQMDFIDRDSLVAAMNAWVLEKTKPLGQILLEKGQLSAEHLTLLEALVEAHLKAHGYDPEKSLAALSSVGPARRELESIQDPDLRSGLSLAGSARTDAETTGPFTPRTAESTAPEARYRILRPYARGGLGEIFVAEDRELHREVALKEIHERNARDDVSKGRFLLEAEITGGLEHPGIVPVYGLGQYADGRPFYAMRFIKGDNLKEAIQRFHEWRAPGGRQSPQTASGRNLEFRQLLRRFIDVCNAIDYAHSRGVLHRDLKPGNIMLGKFGETLIIDWGLAKAAGRSDAAKAGEETTFRPSSGSGHGATAAGAALGTPAYMSPEQAAGRLDLLGPASDVYGLGATLYAVLTGQPPFRDDEAAEVLRKVQRADFPPPRQVQPAVAPALEAICLKAMALRPEDRFLSPHDLAHEIEHWLADEPVSVYRDSLVTWAGRWARRHKPLVTGAASLLLTAVVLLTAGLFAVQREQRRTAQANADLAVALDAEARRRQQARDALDAMSSQIVEDWLAQQKAKDLTDPQKKFLNKALESYEEFARDTGEDEATRAGVAAAHFRVGRIRYKLGQLTDAESAYRRSGELYARMAAEFSTAPAYRFDLAASQFNLGTLLMNTGRANAAETAFRDALALRERLVRDSPANASYRHALARSHNNLGILLENTNQPKAAEADFRDTLALLKQLVIEFPTVPGYRHDLARGHLALANLLLTTGRPKDAEAAYGDAAAIQKKLATDFPTVPDYRFDLAITYTNVGVLLTDAGRLKNAEIALGQALELQKQLAADFPTVPDYRFDLALSHMNLAIVFGKSARPKEAESAYHEAMTIQKQLVADLPTVPEYRNDLANTMFNLGEFFRDRKDYAAARRMYEEALPYHQAVLRANPRDPTYRRYFRNNRRGLAQTLVEMGEHRAAAAAASEFLQAAVEPASDAYRAACIFARSATLAGKDKQLSELERKELVQAYADKAMVALRQAIQNGYKDVAQIKKAPDLDALRSRDDFQKLVTELETAAKVTDK